MKKRIAAVLTALLMAAGLFAGSGALAEAAKEADTVVYGNIWTGDEAQPRAEAMAFTDGKIVYTGTKDGAAVYVGAGTAVVDRSGDFIMPGIIDGHIHNYVDAENKAGCELSGTTALDYLVEIAAYVSENPDETFYKAFGWTDNSFNGTPTAAMLDAICADKPVYIKSEDCHSCWVNTAMIRLCGVTAETQDPVGGVIERDENGEPNGCFRDTAMDYLIKPYVALYSVAEYKEMFLVNQQVLLANGITAYDEVIIDPKSADNICAAYHELEQEGSLKVKVNAALLINNTDAYVEDLAHAAELRDAYSGDAFRITDIKIFMDGIVESETAYVSEPYSDGKTGADRWPGEEGVARLNDLTKRVNDAGFAAHFHAIGDAAVTKALDAIAYAKENSVNKDVRNCMTHFHMISKDDIARFAELGVIAVANLGWAPSMNADIGMTNIEEANVGAARNNAMYPFRSMLEAGVRLSYATDYPAGPVEDPYYNLQAGITREVYGIASTQRNGGECLTADEALTAMTAGGAYQLGRENETGTLSVGKSADFIVLNNDLTATDPNLIDVTTSVLETWVAGEEQLGLA